MVNDLVVGMNLDRNDFARYELPRVGEGGHTQGW